MIPFGAIRHHGGRVPIAAVLLFGLLFACPGRAAESPEAPLTLRIAVSDVRQLKQNDGEDGLRAALYDRFQILLEPVKVPA
ncbi:MAG TPA: hypothetical protein PKE04_10640, partial [Clostridia bacterium]|nr:hypothetical protein [Clostridia bacterium]